MLSGVGATQPRSGRRLVCSAWFGPHLPNPALLIAAAPLLCSTVQKEYLLGERGTRSTSHVEHVSRYLQCCSN